VTDPAHWRDWVLLALADSGGQLDSEFAVIEEVAIRFADRFGPTDRSYLGEQPLWHDAVKLALEELRSERLVRQRTQRTGRPAKSLRLVNAVVLGMTDDRCRQRSTGLNR